MEFHNILTQSPSSLDDIDRAMLLFFSKTGF